MIRLAIRQTGAGGLLLAHVAQLDPHVRWRSGRLKRTGIEMTYEAKTEATTEVRVAETAEAVRQVRFGQLPERIRLEDMVAAQPASVPDPAKDSYNEDEWLVRYCL